MHLITQLKANNIIQHGQYTLKSGQQSHIYFNFKSLIHHPTLLIDVCYQLSKLITQPHSLAAVPMGAIPLTTLLTYLLNRPMLLIRPEKKNHGTQQQIEGYYDTVVLIEDVITTAGSVINMINLLKENQINVSQIICILDRQAGGVDKLKSLGYHVSCLYQLNDFLVLPPQPVFKTNDCIQKLLDITKSKQTNIIASLDCDNLYDVIDIVGPHVCAIKIHGDIYPHLNIDLINHLKQKYHFLVIEDRKLSDIASICLKQTQLIKRYADIVTVHGLCGETMINTISHLLPVIIVCNMSSKDHLMDQIYINKVLDMNCHNLVGYVSQYKIEHHLTFTPGIHINKTHDKLDQQYQSPTHLNSDYYIIGRGIYEGDVLNNVLMYKQLCYKNNETI
jgi:orotate phosphoribosyltransferase/orotidine 5'-phosphate decarboxylase subfamily 1